MTNARTARAPSPSRPAGAGTALRGLPYITSAKISDFLPPPPCHCHKSADSVPLVCFLGTPSPTHYGCHIWKPPNCIGEIHNVEIVPPWQSSSKPFTYGVCLNELGRDTVHQYVGQEPSGRMFNELSLDNNSEENFIEFSVIFPRGWGSYS